MGCWTATWKVWPGAYGAPGGQERMVGAGADAVWLTLTGPVRPGLAIVTGWDFRLGWKTGSDFTATVADFVSETEPVSKPI